MKEVFPAGLSYNGVVILLLERWEELVTSLHLLVLQRPIPPSIEVQADDVPFSVRHGCLLLQLLIECFLRPQYFFGIDDL